jgi:hypothetical protein
MMSITPNQPEDALRASVDILQTLHRYNEERKAAGRRPIRIGIGLHTGPLIMGIIGDQQRLDAAAQLFLNKSAQCITSGVPDDWTGVEIMAFK